MFRSLRDLLIEMSIFYFVNCIYTHKDHGGKILLPFQHLNLRMLSIFLKKIWPWKEKQYAIFYLCMQAVTFVPFSLNIVFSVIAICLGLVLNSCAPGCACIHISGVMRARTWTSQLTLFDFPKEIWNSSAIIFFFLIIFLFINKQKQVRLNENVKQHDILLEPWAWLAICSFAATLSRQSWARRTPCKETRRRDQFLIGSQIWWFKVEFSQMHYR